jgi:hypothetical protein
MWNGENLLDLDGATPHDYARKLAHTMWDYKTLGEHRIVEGKDSKQNQTKRVPFSHSTDVEKIKLIKTAIKSKFDFRKNKFGLIWKHCCRTINDIGKNYNNRKKE